MDQTLPAGATLAHYRIVERIGVGGMGEVYKAFDTSLERAVALKILPPELVSHQDRLQRFVLEAKAASGLSHPNIVTIHEIGSAQIDGQEGEQFHYIAMELIEGETLRQLIHRERRLLVTLLDYLAQAADGLAKAHGAGIIHRDLKPENIMVTGDGFAKILDFGLAKLVERKTTLSTDVDAPTAVKENTREGMILGTLGYMSPEQVEAKPVDGRSDIFSFGCILYEAVTRKKPFTGDSDVDLLHKILHGEPEPVADSNPDVPWELRRIIRRCLAKNPDKRYQSMKDLANELRDLVEDYDQLTPGSGSRTMSGSSVGPAGQPRNRTTLIAALIIAGLLVAAAVLYQSMRRPASQVASSSQMSMKPLTSTGKAILGKISPDGRYLAYVGEERGQAALYLKQIASGSEVPVVPPSPTLRFSGLTFSRDGDYLYITSGEAGSGVNTLSVVPTLGGAPRTLINDVDSAVALSPDEKEVAFIRAVPTGPGHQLIIALLEGGKERVAAERGGGDFFSTGSTPAWSPDGKVIATAGGSVAQGLRTTILLVSADDGETRDLIRGDWFEVGGLAWLPDGSGLVTTGQQLEGPIYQVWIFPYPEGEPRRITNDLSSYRHVSISADGKSLVALAGNERSVLWKVHDSTASALTTEGEGNVPREFWLLPDGSAVFASLASGNYDIWRWMPDGERRQLTTHARADYGASASPNGDTVYFLTERNGASELWKMHVKGAGQTFVAKVSSEIPPEISPDGRWFVFAHLGKVWRLSSAGGEPVLLSDVSGASLSLSPDGSMIGGFFRLSPLPATMELAVMREGDKTPRRIGTFDPTTIRGWSRWTPDGSSLTYVSRKDGAENIMAQPIDGGKPVQLTNFSSGKVVDYRWHRGELYVSRGSQFSDMVMISDFQ